MSQIQASSINFIGNEIQNVSLQKLVAAPPAPIVGQIYYNTTDNRVYVCINVVGPVWLALDAEDAPSETVTTLGAIIAGATGTTTPADEDLIPITDSTASHILRKFTWANLKARLGALYAAATHYHNASDINAGTLPVARGGLGTDNLGVFLASVGIMYGTASAASGASKVVNFSVNPITLRPGSLFVVNCASGFQANQPLNINSTEYGVYTADGAGLITSEDAPAPGLYLFTYNGGSYVFMLNPRTLYAKTQSVGNSSTAIATTAFVNAEIAQDAPNETAGSIGTIVGGATAKATPVDADLILLGDSTAANIIRKFTWANLKAALVAAWSTTFAAYSHVGAGGAAHADVIAGGADGFMTGADKTKLDGIAPSANAYVHPNHTGDVTSTGDGATAIGANKVLNTMLADMASMRVKGNLSGASADPSDIVVQSTLASSATELATAAAIKTYIDNLLASNDAMVFKGSVGTGGTLEIAAFNALVVYNAGWAYRVISAGTIKGKVCEIGDMLVATVDRASGGVDADWIVLQTNADGVVTGPASSTDGYLVLWNGTTGKIIKNSTINPANLVQGPASASDGNIPLYDGTTGKLIKNSTYSPASFAPAVHNHDTVYVKKAFTQTVGGATSEVITHNLGTRAFTWSLYQSTAPYAEVHTALERTSLNTATIFFGVAPGAGEYTIVIIG